MTRSLRAVFDQLEADGAALLADRVAWRQAAPPPRHPPILRRRRKPRRYADPAFEARRRALVAAARECLPLMLGFYAPGGWPQGRWRALGVLGHARDVGMTRLLLRVSRDHPDATVRAYRMQTATQVCPQVFWRDLVAGARDPDPMTRRLAVQGLMFLRHGRHRVAAREALLAVARDAAEDAAVRRQAIQSLHGITHRDVAAVMGALAAGPEGSVQAAADGWLRAAARRRATRRAVRRRALAFRAGGG